VAAKFKIKTTTFRACPKRWNQDLDFQGHMSSFYLCSVSEGETWLFILLIILFQVIYTWSHDHIKHECNHFKWKKTGNHTLKKLLGYE
jgi:fatty acid desaturase